MMPAAVASLTLCALLGLQAPQQAPPVRVLPADAYAKTLVDAVSASELRRYHDLIAMEPHVAGTVGDVRQIERIRQAFEAMNLATRVERFRCLLCRPISASLEIVDDGAEPAAAAPSQRRGVVSLPIGERNLLEDPATAHPDLTYGWNAYSGNGDVTAPAVYANYATREDFAKLKELGVDVKGKIVIARYGKCFRGYKAWLRNLAAVARALT
jgi:N-acetylated-alpha-linked acidic dipeptidase